MKNYLQDGDIVVVTAPEAVNSGEFIKVGQLFGVAQVAADNGTPVPLVRNGVFELPKATGAAWTQGDQLYWDASAKNFTKNAAGNDPIGVAFADAGADDTTGSVSLDKGESAAIANAIAGVGANYKIARGQHTTVTAADTIATGLTTVLSVVASFETDPADANTLVSAQVGDQAGAPVAGSVIIKTWKSGDGADVTPVAASAFSKKVNWIAVGV